MNDIAKTNIKEKLEMAINKESLKPGRVAEILDIRIEYFSMIKNKNHWGKCPQKAWDNVLSWVNSGESLVKYESKREKLISIDSKENIAYDIFKSKSLNKIIKGKAILIKLLREEKTLLEKKIKAVNTLLEYYSDKNT